MFEATRGETAFFTIQAYDDFDNPKGYGGDEFKVSFENEELHFDITPRDNGDGTYLVTYCPTRVYVCGHGCPAAPPSAVLACGALTLCVRVCVWCVVCGVGRHVHDTAATSS